MGTLREDIAAEATKMRTSDGVAVKYARGDVEITISKAIKFPARRRALMSSIAIDLAAQDWAIGVADLVLSGATTEPQRGDRITFVATGEVFEALPDEGDAVWHYTAADSQFRIHTKRI